MWYGMSDGLKCEIAEAVVIWKERVGYVLHEELHMKKLCTRWVLCMLTAHQKRIRVKIFKCLEHFYKNKTDFVHWFISMNEMLIHH